MVAVLGGLGSVGELGGSAEDSTVSEDCLFRLLCGE